MKLLKKISQFAAIVFGVGSLVLFFLPFASIVTSNATANPVGAALAFGGTVKVGTASANLAMSGHIFLVLLIMVIAILMSIFAYKSKGLRYSSSAFALISAIYMWVIKLSNPTRFVDTRPIEAVTSVKYTSFVLYLAIALTVFTLLAVAYLLIDDYIEAKATGGKTIWQKIVLFFRDNKSELKKIVWPSFHDVVKNTITVLVMCLVIGVLIWAIDLGLGQLLKLILK